MAPATGIPFEEQVNAAITRTVSSHRQDIFTHLPTTLLEKTIDAKVGLAAWVIFVNPGVTSHDRGLMTAGIAQYVVYRLIKDQPEPELIYETTTTFRRNGQPLSSPIVIATGPIKGINIHQGKIWLQVTNEIF